MRFFGPILALAFALSGCNITTEEICQQRLPEMQKSLENALEVLRDWHEDRAGRDLASLGEKPEPQPTPGMSDSDRASWEKWAEGHLLETQQYLDKVPTDPRFRGARAALTEMANQFVAFHGYTGESKTGKMIHALELIHADGERIGQDVCPKIAR
jgi:hypothetical protein